MALILKGGMSADKSFSIDLNVDVACTILYNKNTRHNTAVFCVLENK